MSKMIRSVIRGKNEIVLPLLYERYGSFVDCVYIDPPYNNGEEYKYYTDSRKHDAWIELMTESLSAIWPVIKEDGSLWISIDDAEMPHLRILCDSLFGQGCFVASIVWQQRNTRENRKAFSADHEYIIVYSKSPQQFKQRRNLLPAPESVLARYKNPDEDPRGPWQSVSLNVQAGHAVPSQFYDVISPTGKVFSPPAGRCWAYNKERMEKEIAENNVWFGKTGNAVPRAKKFLADANLGLVPSTLWLSDEVGTNQDAKKHVKMLFPNEDAVFETPKPESLLKRIIEISTNEGEIVLDAFLGSGTTAATAHKLGRGYIGIESEDKVFDLVQKRMSSVFEGEQGGISEEVGWTGGGFCDFLLYPGDEIDVIGGDNDD